MSASSDSVLAAKFSPILILTEETGRKWGDIRVLRPERVEIIDAQSADSIRFQVYNHLGQKIGGVRRWRSLDHTNWQPPPASIDFAQNRFAFLTRKYTGRPFLDGTRYAHGQYHISSYFDYPGKGPGVWNDTYFGSGSQSGSHPDNTNTAYVHIYETTHEAYTDSVTVIQYFYFYPYNHWWNRHEGDWQRVHVVVNSRNPNDVNIEVLGVEYLIHKAHLSYYKNFPITYNLLGQTVEDSGRTYPDLTSRFVFNPRRNITLSQGSHPVVYVGAGSHASFPAGGKIRIYDKDVFERGIEIHERMTHTGLVLSTQADGSHGDLWESYDLVVLPEPDPTNANNMGLVDGMSWLGADVLWGTPSVDSPDSDIPVIGQQGNESPQGPYHKGWEELKFFRQGSTGGDFKFLFIDSGHPFRYKDVPDSYHHWTIIGQESWNETASASDDTLSLSGDVVVFPGATLTINAGTVVEFEPGSDRHQFSAGSTGVADRTEIFVYGTLVANGTVRDSVRFQKSDTAWQGASAWGGIRIMEGGSVTLHHTGLRDHSRPRIGPTGLSAHAGRGEATLRWDNQSLSDPSITGWEYRTKPESATQWGDWTAVSGRATRETLVSNLAHGVLHQFEVRAVNTTGGGPASAVSVALLQVVFVSSSYTLIEGGQAVAAGPVGLAEDPSQAYRRARVTVQLTPAPSAAVRIPVAVAPGSSGYEVDDLDAAGLLFSASRTSASFVIRAVRDPDTEDESIGLSFGTLPAGVVAGVPSSSTVTIYDTPEPADEPDGDAGSRPDDVAVDRPEALRHRRLAVLGAACGDDPGHLGYDRRQRGVDDRGHGAEPDRRQAVQLPGAGLHARVRRGLRNGEGDAHRPAGDGLQRGGGAGLGRSRHRGPVGLADPASAVAGRDIQLVYGACRRGGDACGPGSEERPGVPVRGAGAERGGGGAGSVSLEDDASVYLAGGGDAEGEPVVAAERGGRVEPVVDVAAGGRGGDGDAERPGRAACATPRGSGNGGGRPRRQWTAVDGATSSSHAPSDRGPGLHAAGDGGLHRPARPRPARRERGHRGGGGGSAGCAAALPGGGRRQTGVVDLGGAGVDGAGCPCWAITTGRSSPGDTTGWVEFQKSWTRYQPNRICATGCRYTFEVRARNRGGGGGVGGHDGHAGGGATWRRGTSRRCPATGRWR